MSAQFAFRVVLTVAFLYLARYGAAAQLPSVETSAGVDARGVHHTWTTDRTKPAPWQADVTKLIPPDYPYVARRAKQEGSGLFGLEIELATGKVTKATILKSTGVAVLDNSALWALRRWQLKPGRWRELDVPVTFTMSAPMPAAPPSRPHK
jgi:TonB family protein